VSGTALAGRETREREEERRIREAEREEREAQRSRRNYEKCWSRAVDENSVPINVLGASAILAVPYIPKILVEGRSIGSSTVTLLSVIGHFWEINLPASMAVGRISTDNALRFAGRAGYPLVAFLAVATTVELAVDVSKCYDFEMSHPMPGER
jgi:hypothetical protein